jgi:hypothetical protein
MNTSEKRRTIRRSISYPALIDPGDGSPPRECSLCDASKEGAQLMVADPASLPERFILALSADGAARRRCQIIWRQEKLVGVRFLKEPKPAPRPARHGLSPYVSPNISAPDDETKAAEAFDSVTQPPR